MGLTPTTILFSVKYTTMAVLSRQLNPAILRFSLKGTLIRYFTAVWVEHFLQSAKRQLAYLLYNCITSIQFLHKREKAMLMLKQVGNQHSKRLRLCYFWLIQQTSSNSFSWSLVITYFWRVCFALPRLLRLG